MTPDDEYVEITRKLMKADSTGKSFHTPPAKGKRIAAIMDDLGVDNR